MNTMRVNKLILPNNLAMHGDALNLERQKLYQSAKHKHNSIDKYNQFRPAERVSLGGSELLKDNLTAQPDMTASVPSFTGKEKVIKTTAEMVKGITKEAINKGAMEDIPKWADKMGGANFFKGLLKSVDKSETFFEAVTALVIAGMLKPICVLAMPGAEMEDKEMSATKNAVSAFIGFGLSNLILGPFSSAVNKIVKSVDSKDPTKYIKDINYVDAIKNEELITLANGTKLKSTLGDAFKTTYKKLPDLAVSPMKAALTIALTPYILKFLFKKDKAGKNSKKKNPVENPMNKMTVMNTIRMNSNNVHQAQPAFSGSENKQKSAISFTGNVKNSTTSFKGSLASEAADNAQDFFASGVRKVIEKAEKDAPSKGFKKLKELYNALFDEHIAKGIGRIAPRKMGQKLVETTARFEKPSARWSDLASFAITYFYVSNTAKSEKIEEERKLPLMINNVMVTAASSTAAFLIDKYTDKPMENLLRSYLKHRDADLFNKSNSKIVDALKIALDEGADSIDLDAMKRHSDELLSGGWDNFTDALKDSITALKNNDVVQRAIKENIIENDDIAKLAASGFEKQAKSIYGNISKAKSLTVFTLTVRFLVTVLMTPVIGQVVALVNKKLGRGEYAKDNKQNQPANVPLPGSETFGMKDYMKTLSGVTIPNSSSQNGANNLFNTNAQNQSSSIEQKAEDKKDDDDDDDKDDDDDD